MTHPVPRSCLSALLLSFLLACPAPPGEPPADLGQDAATSLGDAAAGDCQLLTAVSYSALASQVTATGQLVCPTAAALELRLCLYDRAVGSSDFGDPLICKSAAASGERQLQSEVAVGVLLSTRREYRSTLSATRAGRALPAVQSAVLTAP